ncbi:MAG: DNA polymerase IV [Deltaproteobacteria bacterium]
MAPDPSVREVVHCDMDAFYASVEALDDPGLAGKPVIVGGGERRGVVAASSYEARRYGVHSAMPMATAKRLCPGGVFLPVRMARYRDVSDLIFGIFRRFTPLVEPVSIDEAFLDVTASIRLFGAPEAIAQAIKTAVRGETGLTVSAGVAPSKLVAKIASDMRKPDGLTVVPRGTEREFLSPLPVEKLWGVGPVTREALRAMGVGTIGELARAPARVLEAKLGESGLRLHRLANGIDEREVETDREARSIGHEDTYDEDIRDAAAMRKEILGLADRVAARLRREGVKGRTVTLKVKYADFTAVTRAVTLSRATDDGGEVYRSAVPLLAKTRAGRQPVRLLGISVSRLAVDDGSREETWDQMLLFGGKPPHAAGEAPSPGPATDPARVTRLNQAVDRIREKFGKKGIRPATLADPE